MSRVPRRGGLDVLISNPRPRSACDHHGAELAPARCGFALEADRIESWKRGGVQRPYALRGGLKLLLETYCKYRPTVPAAQGKRPGSFGALATDMFAGAPCNFGTVAVRHAVAELLPLTAPERQMAKVAGDAETRREKFAYVRIIGSETGFAKVISDVLEADEAEVRLDLWGAPAPPAEEAADDDLLLIVPDVEELLSQGNTTDAPPVDNEDIMRKLVSDPLRELDILDAGDKPKRVAIVLPVLPEAREDRVRASMVVHAARAALVALMQLCTRRPGWENTAVVVIQPDRGIMGGGVSLPLTLLSQHEIAVILLGALTGVGTDHSGRAFDLFGNPLPTLPAAECSTPP